MAGLGLGGGESITYHNKWDNPYFLPFFIRWTGGLGLGGGESSVLLSHWSSPVSDGLLTWCPCK